MCNFIAWILSTHLVIAPLSGRSLGWEVKAEQGGVTADNARLRIAQQLWPNSLSERFVSRYTLCFFKQKWHAITRTGHTGVLLWPVIFLLLLQVHRLAHIAVLLFSKAVSNSSSICLEYKLFFLESPLAIVSCTRQLNSILSKNSNLFSLSFSLFVARESRTSSSVLCTETSSFPLVSLTWFQESFAQFQ